MVALSKSVYNILKETIRVFKRNENFTLLGDRAGLNNEGLFFQDNNCFVHLKSDLLSTRIGRDNVLIFKCSDLLGIIDSPFTTEYIQSPSIIAVTFSSGAKYGFQVEEKPLHEVVFIPRRRTRIGQIFQEDLPFIRVGLHFVLKTTRLSDNRYASLMAQDRIYSSDGYFGYRSPSLIESFDEVFRIPQQVAKIIYNSDKGIVVRADSQVIELENDYFRIVYDKNHADVDHFKAAFDDSSSKIITTSKSDLVKAMKSMSGLFKSVSGSKTRMKDMEIYINGEFRISHSDKAKALVNSFDKQFMEDLSFDTNGNRFLKILNAIDDDKIKIQIPDSKSGALIINDTYLLMSWLKD